MEPYSGATRYASNPKRNPRTFLLNRSWRKTRLANQSVVDSTVPGKLNLCWPPRMYFNRKPYFTIPNIAVRKTMTEWLLPNRRRKATQVAICSACFAHHIASLSFLPLLFFLNLESKRLEGRASPNPPTVMEFPGAFVAVSH